MYNIFDKLSSSFLIEKLNAPSSIFKPAGSPSIPPSRSPSIPNSSSDSDTVNIPLIITLVILGIVLLIVIFIIYNLSSSSKPIKATGGRFTIGE